MDRGSYLSVLIAEPLTTRGAFPTSQQCCLPVCAIIAELACS